MFFSNVGIEESGPIFEIPLDLVPANYETNVFAPLHLSQGFAAKWITEGKKSKIIFTSSKGGLFTPFGYGIYVSTKHALEAVAEALADELNLYGIKIQTITGSLFNWL